MHYSILDLRINEKALRKNWLILIKSREFLVELKLFFGLHLPAGNFLRYLSTFINMSNRYEK